MNLRPARHHQVCVHLSLAGAEQEELALAAAEGAAWVAFQRMAAWWLGENANVASDEYAGTSGVPPATPEGEGLINPGSGRVEITTDNRPLSAGEARSPDRAVVLHARHRVSTVICN